MKLSIKKELPIIGVIVLPIIYLAYIWSDLPQQVPVHWDLQGEINRYGSKKELAIITLSLPILLYVIFLVVPYIDPKGQIHKMGAKYGNLKFLIILLMSVISVFILYNSKNQPNLSPNYIIPILGILLMVFGNYFKTIKPNYFLGIRTPWTLENKDVWKKTHHIAGKIWFFGGLSILITSIFLNSLMNIKITLFTILGLALIPIIYSYTYFKKIENPLNSNRK